MLGSKGRGHGFYKEYAPLAIKQLLSPIETWYSNTIYIID